MYTSLVLYFSIFALSKERTRLSFHCWLYNLCIPVYVTNKTWNLNLKLAKSRMCGEKCKEAREEPASGLIVQIFSPHLRAVQSHCSRGL